jgi:UDP-N-acetylglucosamine transferase subunit ALG13
MEGVKNNKKIIAAPRLKKYNEHVNDHQLQIIDTFTEMGYILPLKDFNMLGKLLKKIEKFQPKKFESNTNNMINLIDSFINQ